MFISNSNDSKSAKEVLSNKAMTALNDGSEAALVRFFKHSSIPNIATRN